MSTARPVSATPADLALKAELEHRAELYWHHRAKLEQLHERALIAGWTESQVLDITREYLR